MTKMTKNKKPTILHLWIMFNLSDEETLELTMNKNV